VYVVRQLVPVLRLSRLSACLDGTSRLRRTTGNNFRIYTLLPPDDGQLANPKHTANPRITRLIRSEKSSRNTKTRKVNN
jgi:hypothetical protein